MIVATRKQKQIPNIGAAVKSTALVGVAAGGVYVGYLGVLAFASFKDGVTDIVTAITDKVYNIPLDFYNWTAGSLTETNPETGIDMIVPKTVTDDFGLVIENPAGGVPVVGGLAYLGLLIGNRFNPVTAAGYNPNEDTTVPPSTDPSWLEWIAEVDPNYDFVNDQWSPQYLAMLAAKEAARLAELERHQAWVDANLAEEKRIADEEQAERDAAAAAAAKAAQDHFAQSGMTEDGEVPDYFVRIPDDSRRPMTLLEWAIWAGRNNYGGRRDDVTDSGIAINSTGLHDYYIDWYRQHVGKGSDER